MKNILERLYAKYNRRELIKPDPLQFVYNYTNHLDMEAAGFLSAALAYGRVQQIEKDLTDLFTKMGKSPSAFILDFNNRQADKLDSFKHRFTSGSDISELFFLLKQVLTDHGSIEHCFTAGLNKTDKNIIAAMGKFCDLLADTYRRLRHREPAASLLYLFVNPSGKSACKRLNLFLRWMVRDDDVDAGLWKEVDKSQLIVPVDVHMGRLCKILGFYNRSTVDLKTAVEITDSFKKLCPEDPVKYDFALSRIGIVENCTGRPGKYCKFCTLREFCGGN